MKPCERELPGIWKESGSCLAGWGEDLAVAGQTCQDLLLDELAKVRGIFHDESRALGLAPP